MVSKKEFSSDINHYLSYDIASHVFSLAVEQYELPRMTKPERWAVQQSFADSGPRFGPILTADEATFKRFKRVLLSEFGGRGDEGVLDAIMQAGDCNFFAHSKTAVKNNAQVAKALGPNLGKWVESAALFIADELAAIREATRAREIQELERLAKKHGRKLS
jgi:hypothetical protein